MERKLLLDAAGHRRSDWTTASGREQASTPAPIALDPHERNVAEAIVRRPSTRDGMRSCRAEERTLGSGGDECERLAVRAKRMMPGAVGIPVARAK